MLLSIDCASKRHADAVARLQVSGEFLRNKEQLNCTLSGAWDKEVHVSKPNGAQHTLWSRPPFKPDSR